MDKDENKEKGLTIHTDRAGKEALEKVMEAEVKDAKIVLPDSEEAQALQEKYDAILEKAKAGGMKNIPYRKIFNELGVLANPIKNGGFYNPFPNRQARRKLLRVMKGTVPRNNGRGTRVIVKQTGEQDFLKYHIREQFIPAKMVAQYDIETDAAEPVFLGFKYHKARTVQHYVLATKF